MKQPYIYLLLGLISCFSIGEYKTKAADNNQPNVVIILADDMNSYRSREMGINVKTPNLDELEQQSVLFTNANCAAPVCTPSRSALFSGLYPHNTGCYTNGGGFWAKSEQLIDCTTFPELFRISGYETFGRGKLTHDGSSREHDKRMWSTPAKGNGGFGPFLDKEYQFVGKFWGSQEWDDPDSLFPDVKSVNQTVEFINNYNSEKPFMLMVGLWRPHTPFTAPRRFFEMYDSDEIGFPVGYKEDDMNDVPPPGLDYMKGFAARWKNSGVSNMERWIRVIHGYVACCSFVDWSVGEIIRALDANDLFDNTIFIFTSDNGFHMGEKHKFGKGTMWENSANVPLLIRLPGNKNAGKTCHATVNLIDLYPTLRELCELSGPKQELDGNSMTPLLNNPTKKWKFSALTCYNEHTTSLRTDKWRYILYKDGTEELFDIVSDPHEFTNLASRPEYDKIKAKLRKSLPNHFEKWINGKPEK